MVRSRYTTSGIYSATTYFILGLLVAMGGCAAVATPAHRAAIAPTYSPDGPFTATQEPSAQHQDDSSAARTAAAEELGPGVAEAMPHLDKVPPQPRDPGADQFVAALLTGLGPRQHDENGATRICVSKLRNQSRAQQSEFAAFQERFAEVLTRSSSESNVTFCTGSDAHSLIHYELLGTAYLITTDGFDVWELFIMVTPADKSWMVWQPTGPVRVLRHPRPNQQQVFPSREAR
jgi:hypothetical protein